MDPGCADTASLKVGDDEQNTSDKDMPEAQAAKERPADAICCGLAELWNDFLIADEVDQVERTFKAILTHTGTAQLHEGGIALFRQLKCKLEPGLDIDRKVLLTELERQISRRQVYLARLRGEENPVNVDTPQGDILICGAGPVGLRTAVEAALLGFKTTVVERRTSFSRHNILTLWDVTYRDVLSLGANIYFPHLKPAQDSGTNHESWFANTEFFMGTRELQLTFLKTALLCGAKMLYGMELIGLIPPDKDTSKWQGRVVPYVKQNSQAEPLTREDTQARSVVEDVKKDKTDAYARTTKCNLVELTTVDETFINASAALFVKDEIRSQFDHYIIAEGEWSSTTRKCGFDKSIDRFGKAIGLIINAVYDKNDPAQVGIQSTRGFQHFPELHAAGIMTEGVEYLKGETHYIAACILKRTLVEFGAVHNDKPTTKELLQPCNLNMDGLRRLARIIATTIGLPETCTFCQDCGVQLFDFSTRARCKEGVKLLSGGAHAPGRLTSSTQDHVHSAAEAGNGLPALVMPVGDAYMEPFWVQGLGTNRGFHTGLNAVSAAVAAREFSIVEGAKEARFAHHMIVGMANFLKRDITPAHTWTADATTRFVPECIDLAREKIRRRGSEVDDLPERFSR
eukprot:TRINITY_DN74352_c0_g1_i1.p1 TRINITY_DN74352_c0_g1~~TRINITY_DN74352_c0_g1_i1.p1  ORF type:complete len:628 (+),score=85.55 TRINITY_DN74352_c0_g1_i1:77-1960(+)